VQLHRLAAFAVVACAVAALTAAGGATAAAPKTRAAAPVPSLTPKATDALWRRLVRERNSRSFRATADCRPLRAVFYAPTDWLRLTTKLAAAASPCAQYYVTVPPLVADKSQPRADQAWRIRALGPSFHALAEIHVAGWTTWLSNNPGKTWFEAGVEARRRMAAAGYDVSLGDGWALNELSSAVRVGNGNARANMRAFLRGLYEGDGTLPRVPGAVFITGMNQGTGELSVYQARVQDWYEDAAFWQDMSAYVSDWSQELYGDIRSYAVTGVPLDARRDSLNDYLQHQVALARVAPPSSSAAAAFIESASSPLGNAAWAYDAAFGWTAAPIDLMQHFVSAQTYALRSAGNARFGFAWSPKNLWALPTADFAAQTDTLLDRLAAAIRDSAPDGEDLGACGTSWCAGDLDGAALATQWQTFDAWKPSRLAFTTAPVALVAGTEATYSVELRTATGVPYAAGLPVTVSLRSTSPAGRFAAAGDWSPTLDVTIPNGATSVTFRYQDATAGTASLTASAAGKLAATLAVDVSAASLAHVVVAPSSVALEPGGSATFTASTTDAYGNPVAADVAWSTTAPGVLSGASGASTSFQAGPGGGSGNVTATAGGVTGSASVTVSGGARVASVSYVRISGGFRMTMRVVDGAGRAIAGTTVGYRIRRNGVIYATRTGITAWDGTVSPALSVPSGCYTTAVTSLSVSGWDGITPPNSFCK
jgi:hypothetical protein